MGKFSDNIVFWSAFIAWIIAQFLKGIFAFYKYRKMDFRRFVGAGGMPSSHSAFVSALATVFALVVMYDAAGVRLAASKQAATLNKIVDELFDEGEFHHEHLKELLGHTPVEVIVGSLLGIVISYWMIG